MATAVRTVWEELEQEAIRTANPTERLYRALGASAIGIRAGYLPNQQVLDLLIEIPQNWSGKSVIPEWRGMGLELISLALPPRTGAHHLRLFLLGQQHREVFLTVCEDLVSALEGVTNAKERVSRIEACLLRWRRFFERTGPDGLTAELQQALFAELTWLERLLETGIEPSQAVSAWKGCEHGYHDFDLKGRVVEVKSTRTKEPRTAVISNERQLDDRGLLSLHLYVLSIHETEGGGVTLPMQVGSVRSALAGAPAALAAFGDGLISYGYLDHDAKRYTTQLIIKAEDLFAVTDGFPRITIVPPGVGDLRYGVLLGACEPFRVTLNNYLADLMEC